MTRKILMVSNMYPSDEQIIFGVFIRNIENTLKSGGFDVSLEVISGRGVTLVDKIRKYLRFYWNLINIDLSDFDLIHISYPSHSFFPFFFKKRKGAKIIVRLHGHDLVAADKETIIFKIMRKLTILACKRADGVIVPSPFFLRELKKNANNIDVPVMTIPSGGIDPTIFRPMSCDARDPKVTCFGYVGRLDQGKGVDVFVRAFARLGGNSRAIIVGGGPMHAALQQLIADLGIGDRCQLVGPVDYKNLPYYYNKFDLFVFPTLFRESFGNVLLEAMACGLPVLASDQGAPADFVNEGINGFKVPPGDIDQLAAVMTKFCHLAPEERDILQKGALSTARQYYSEVISQRYCEYVSSVAE